MNFFEALKKTAAVAAATTMLMLVGCGKDAATNDSDKSINIANVMMTERSSNVIMTDLFSLLLFVVYKTKHRYSLYQEVCLCTTVLPTRLK